MTDYEIPSAADVQYFRYKRAARLLSKFPAKLQNGICEYYLLKYTARLYHGEPVFVADSNA